MTTSNHKKILKQLIVKPSKLKKFIKHNEPKKRKCGQGLRKCKICGRTHAYIQKYNLNICRQCFRENAKRLGFKKFI
ncbi:MAG: 30S ribosomal protein S14 [Nanoarchaeota archaeon]|nr:30S ribosomal protein S14 [Nanoarchaeota archaeon]